MNYFIFPIINNFLNDDNIRPVYEKDICNIVPYVNKSVYKYLYESKNLIENNILYWNSLKKYTNPYEFIHTLYDKQNCISKLKPLSRAFYKMSEIIHTFNLFKDYKNDTIKSFHLAEGPGGFIEAFVYYRKNPYDIYYGMTLVDSVNQYIPGWKKSNHFLEKNKNVKIEKGVTGNGDLYNYLNLEYCYKNYYNSIDIITGDGGFDFSIDFDKQEQMVYKLLFAQIIFALVMQKKGGSFILKVFDTFTLPTIELLFLLSVMYKSVYITKPNTSRYANSEKYVVCRDFKGIELNTLTKLMNVFKQFIERKDEYIFSLFDFPINEIYLRTIKEINCILGQQQIETIHRTITLIKNNMKKNEKIEKNTKHNINLCIDWCKKHNIPYNEYKQKNLFL